MSVSHPEDGRHRALHTNHMFGFDLVDADDLDDIVDRVLDGPGPHDGLPLVVTPNVDQLVKLDHPMFAALRSQLEQAFIVLPDGQPLVWASRLAGRPLSRRLAGSDLFPLLWARLRAERRPTLVVAPSDIVANGLGAGCPDVVTLVPPLLDPTDPTGLLRVADSCRKLIREHSIEHVVIGIGFPNRERLAVAILEGEGASVPVLSLLGGSLEMYLGLTRRAPAWMRRHGLEWLHRFVLQPRRLFRRYFVDSLRFAPILLGEIRRARREDRDGRSTAPSSGTSSFRNQTR